MSRLVTTINLGFAVLVALFVPVSLIAGTTFAPPAQYFLFGGDAGPVAVADLNGDGHPDLIVAMGLGGENNQGLLSILLGQGDRTFSLSSQLNSGAGFATFVSVADLYGDGTPDLIVANCGSTSNTGNCPNEVSDGVVAVLLGNGDGTFQLPLTYDSGGGYARSIAIADVNLDGVPDVLVGNDCGDMSCTTGGGVGVMLGNGDGTLKAAVPYSGIGGGAISITDLNRDGIPDIVVGGSQIGVLLGIGDGTFQFDGFYDIPGPSSALMVVSADVNRDGNPDVIGVAACGDNNCKFGQVSVLMGNGDGTLQAAVPYGSGAAVPASLAVADLNADGNLDLIVANCSHTRPECGSTEGVVSGRAEEMEPLDEEQDLLRLALERRSLQSRILTATEDPTWWQQTSSRMTLSCS